MNVIGKPLGTLDSIGKYMGLGLLAIVAYALYMAYHNIDWMQMKFGITHSVSTGKWIIGLFGLAIAGYAVFSGHLLHVMAIAAVLLIANGLEGTWYTRAAPPQVTHVVAMDKAHPAGQPIRLANMLPEPYAHIDNTATASATTLKASSQEWVIIARNQGLKPVRDLTDAEQDWCKKNGLTSDNAKRNCQTGKIWK